MKAVPGSVYRRRVADGGLYIEVLRGDGRYHLIAFIHRSN